MWFLALLSFLVTAVHASSYLPCLVTYYTQLAPAVASCNNITIQDLFVPGNNSLNLSNLSSNSLVTFSGNTTFGFTNSSGFTPILFGGKNITITALPGSVIDGNGTLYWDGLGSNGGLPKPNHFIRMKLSGTGGSVVENLNIKNWPAHLISISSSANLTVRNLFLDNRFGDLPNNRSGNIAAAHNTDGFGVSGSTNITITNTTVYNQDDCVAITSGDHIVVSDMYCSGSHGLSIGSIGGKSNNNVTNILFTNSTIINSENGARIKSNFNTTGFISNITYSNILLTNITSYGIDVQQDYLNGGPNGTPSNGVIIENVLFQNVTGTMMNSGREYYVLCGEGSCSNIQFLETKISGGGNNSFCNMPLSGCPV